MTCWPLSMISVHMDSTLCKKVGGKSLPMHRGHRFNYVDRVRRFLLNFFAARSEAKTNGIFPVSARAALPIWGDDCSRYPSQALGKVYLSINPMIVSSVSAAEEIKGVVHI